MKIKNIRTMVIYMNWLRKRMITWMISCILYRDRTSLATLTTLKVLNIRIARKAVKDPLPFIKNISIRLNITIIASIKFILSFRYSIRPRPIIFMAISMENIDVHTVLNSLRRFFIVVVIFYPSIIIAMVLAITTTNMKLLNICEAIILYMP